MRMSRRMCGMGKAYPSVVYYYDSDGQHTELTGGYTAETSGATVTQSGDYLFFSSEASTTSKYYYSATALAVDLTHINTLYFTGYRTGYDGRCGIGSSRGAFEAYVDVTGSSDAEYSLDVSSYTGVHYLVFRVRQTYVSSRTYGRMWLSEIRGER